MKDKMINTAPFLMVDQPYDQAVEWITRRLSGLDFSVMATFDLPTNTDAHSDCWCPHHGTAECDCRLGVFLVYGGDPAPMSLLAHGYDGKTGFSLVENPGQPFDPYVAGVIRNILARSLSLTNFRSFTQLGREP